MLKKTSTDFKIRFLEEFTREILRGTESYLEIKIKERSKEPAIKEKFRDTSKTEGAKKNIKKLVSDKFQKDKEIFEGAKMDKKYWMPSKNLEELNISSTPYTHKKGERIRIPKKSRFQEPLLPPTVKDISPVPSEKMIEVGKLAPLIRDPLVKVIEIEGPNQQVKVKGMMGNKKTPITLNEDEIKSTIKKFSDEAKIPFEEGFFKAAVGKLTISAIISRSKIGSRFVITKIKNNFVKEY